MMHSDPRNCIYCQASFLANKYSPKQKVCSNPECQKKRQLESMRQWRMKNPGYFKYDESKGVEWLQAQRSRSKQWRVNNPDKVKQYRHEHMEEYRNYMRDYMRKYRDQKKVEGEQAPGAPEANQDQNPNTTNST